MAELLTRRTETLIEKDGLFWGIQYQDGYSTSYGYGPYENAQKVTSRFCKKPEDATYRGSHHVKELRKGRLVTATIQTVITY